MSGEINEFPSIEGNNLNKQKKIVPDDFVDKDLIIIVAFQQWHQGLVDQSINLLEGNDMDSTHNIICLLYTSPSPRDATLSRMPSSA